MTTSKTKASTTKKKSSTSRRVSEILRFLCEFERPDDTAIAARESCGDLWLAFLNRFGREWTYASLPADIARGPERHCFENALRLALARPELAYVEGREALSGHAYCVTAEGVVVDPTWPADLAPLARYFGVALDVGAVIGIRRRVASPVGSILDLLDTRYPSLMPIAEVLLDRRWLQSLNARPLKKNSERQLEPLSPAARAARAC